MTTADGIVEKFHDIDAEAKWTKPFKLDIGAGIQPRGDDFITVDQSKHDVRLPSDGPPISATGPDIIAEMDALPFDDNSAKLIWSSHALEHVAIAKVAPTLREWLRVLVPGGKVIIRVPNMDYVAKYWLTGPDRGWAEALLFGLQTGPGDFHRAAFTPATIRSDLEATGFKVLRVEFRWTHNQETIQAIAIKPPPE